MRNTTWLLDARKVRAIDVEAMARWLEPQSREVYDRIVRDGAKQRFILSRMLLRVAASEYAGRELGAVSITERRGDAPVVTLSAHERSMNTKSPTAGLRFWHSISHSGAWIACCIADAPVGLDIEETLKPRDLHAMSAWFFSAREHAWFERQSNPTEAFYRLWTGKESVYKLAYGRGWRGALASVQFAVEENALGKPSPDGRVRFEWLEPTLACSIATDHERSIESAMQAETPESAKPPGSSGADAAFVVERVDSARLLAQTGAKSRDSSA